AVVEGQHNFLVAQEVIGLEVVEAEAGTTGGVDLDGTLHAERVRVAALGRNGCRRCGGSRSSGWRRCGSGGADSRRRLREGRAGERRRDRERKERKLTHLRL